MRQNRCWDRVDLVKSCIYPAVTLGSTCAFGWIRPRGEEHITLHCDVQGIPSAGIVASGLIHRESWVCGRIVRRRTK